MYLKDYPRKIASWAVIDDFPLHEKDFVFKTHTVKASGTNGLSNPDVNTLLKMLNSSKQKNWWPDNRI